MLNAIDYLHNIGIMHRDIKAENILICFMNKRRCEIKLIDFGLSRILTNDELAENEPYGTLVRFNFLNKKSYAAPEILMNYPYDKSIDK